VPVPDALPVVQMDYMYPCGLVGRRGMSVVDRSTGYGAATSIQWKGASDTFAVTYAVQLLTELGHSELILQCDPEPAAIDACRAIAKKANAKVILRETPVASSSSNGVVERFHRSAQGLCKTFLAHIESKYAITVTERTALWHGL
jgi:hypothetical protein